MLLMFAAGFANLAWMAILAIVMAYEALGRHGARFGLAVGCGLLVLALVAASGVVLGF
jgi:predicted metal-binding membrane protein